MNVELLIAAAERHGPPHGLIIGVLAVAIVGWLIYRAVTRRGSSGADSRTDRGPATTPNAADGLESDRGRGL